MVIFRVNSGAQAIFDLHVYLLSQLYIAMRNNENFRNGRCCVEGKWDMIFYEVLPAYFKLLYRQSGRKKENP
jgi:hypothetical protein